MTKPLTKVRTCPTCAAHYKASQSFEGGRPGTVCPNGHFHTYYEQQRHEQGKSVSAGRRWPKKRPETTGHGAVPRGPDKAALLALLWVGALDTLLAQMPARSLARQMIEGATAQAYRVSRQVLNEQPAERKAA